MFFLASRDIMRIIKSIENKKLVLYGAGKMAEAAIEKLRLLDIEVAYCVEDDMSDIHVEVPVCDVYSLMLEKDDYYIYIVKNDVKKCGRILEGMGLKFYYDYNIFSNAGLLVNIFADCLLDANLGYTLPYKGTDGKGVKIFGDLNNAKRIIAILGGSTSDPCAYMWKSWGEILWEMSGEDTAVVVCAVMGYSSSDEVLKLMRDVIPVNPDIIISYSGVNDIAYNYPYVNSYQRDLYEKIKRIKLDGPKTYVGIEDRVCYGSGHNIPHAERWMNNQRIMKSIASEFGIEYIAFLQPTLYTKKCGEKDEEVLRYVEGNINIAGRMEYINDIKNMLSQREYEYIVDATSWLDEYDGLFYDYCHVEETGNKYIAEKIYQYIMR